MRYLDFSESKFSWDRPIGSYLKVQKVYSEIIRNRKFQLNKLKESKKKFLNVGCGPNINQNYINLDYLWVPGVDICWDITRSIPLESESIEGIFTEHCLEHISFSQCRDAIKDFYRILQPEGVVRIIVPDAELYIDLYEQSKHNKNVNFPYVSDAEKENGFTPIMSVNRIFRDHGHLFAYDAETLTMLLKNAGFINIKKESYMSGRRKDLLIDTESRKIESLYIEGEKPAS